MYPYSWVSYSERPTRYSRLSYSKCPTPYKCALLRIGTVQSPAQYKNPTPVGTERVSKTRTYSSENSISNSSSTHEAVALILQTYKSITPSRHMPRSNDEKRMIVSIV